MNVLTKLLALLGLILLPACTATGGSPLVASASLSGTGTALTDGGGLVAIGQLEGELSLRMKGTGLPVVLPVQVEAGSIYFWADGEGWQQDVTDPWPLWARELFMPAELLELERVLGLEIQWLAE